MKPTSNGTMALLLTEQQAAQALSLSPSMLYHLRRRGEIPFVQIGRAIRYELPALEEWIRTRAIEPSRN